MVKKMLSTLRWWHVVEDTTNGSPNGNTDAMTKAPTTTVTLTLKHDHFSDQSLTFGKIPTFPRAHIKINILDNLISYL